MNNKQLMIMPTRKEIYQSLKENDEAKLYGIGKAFATETENVIAELIKIGVSAHMIEELKDESLDEQVEYADYLHMSVDEIYEWYSFLANRYYAVNKIYKYVQCANSRKEQYYPVISEYVSAIYRGLNELLTDEEAGYLEYVNCIKNAVSDSYADLFPYGSLSEKEIDKYIERLHECLADVLRQVNNLKKYRQLKEDEEIGKQSIGIFGIDKIDDLDAAIRKEHEENEKQKKETVHSLASAMSALRGDKSSSLGAFDAVRNKKNDDGGNGN